MEKQTLFLIRLTAKFENFAYGQYVTIVVWAKSEDEAVQKVDQMIGGGASQELYTIEAKPVKSYGNEVIRLLEDKGSIQPADISVSKESLYCMAKHFTAFLEQYCNDEVAHFGKPCTDCKMYAECKGKWMERILPLLDDVGVSINVQQQEKSKPKSNKSKSEGKTHARPRITYSTAGSTDTTG